MSYEPVNTPEYEQVSSLLAQRVSTLVSLDDAADALVRSAPNRAMLDTIAARNFLKPVENEAVGFWFARFLSVRNALRELIDELIVTSGKHLPVADDDDEWCVFIVGYATACQLVRLDRLMLFEIATSSTMQRKLNEPFDEYRIPRKQYTLIFRSFVDQRDALIIHDAIHHLHRYRARLMLFANDAIIGPLVRDLDRRELWLDSSKRNYLRRFTTYISHAIRRRGVVSVHFRSLSDTLAVDHVLVLRPMLDDNVIDLAIARACKHEGKPYNFDFDFFNTYRLVCTEVVHRAFDGLGGMDLPLTLRAARQTLSAEDFVPFALTSDRLEPVALYSATLGSEVLLTGNEVRQRLLTAAAVSANNT